MALLVGDGFGLFVGAGEIGLAEVYVLGGIRRIDITKQVGSAVGSTTSATVGARARHLSADVVPARGNGIPTGLSVRTEPGDILSAICVAAQAADGIRNLSADGATVATSDSGGSGSITADDGTLEQMTAVFYV